MPQSESSIVAALRRPSIRPHQVRTTGYQAGPERPGKKRTGSLAASRRANPLLSLNRPSAGRAAVRVSVGLGLRLRSRLFRRRSRGGLYRGMSRRRSHGTRSTAGRCGRSTAARGSRGTAGRSRSTAARSRRRTGHRGRSRTGRSRCAARRSWGATAATAVVAAATTMVMVVTMMVMVATATTASTTSTAATAVREQASGRRAWPSDQERCSGHHGQNQGLAKHQRSPHLVKF